MKSLVALLMVAVIPVCAAALPDEPQISAVRLATIVKTLSADDFEGRAPATAAEQKTIDYLVAQMKAAGLEPGGQKIQGRRVWTQDVPLVTASIAGDCHVSISVGGTSRILNQGQEIVVSAPTTGGNTTSISGAPLVFVGYGVTAPEKHWDDFKGVDLRGKIAVVLVNDPDFETGVGDFDGKAMTYYGRWTYKFEEAARRGALGMLIVHETEPAGYGWATIRNSNIVPQFDIVRADAAQGQIPLHAWIQRETAVQIFHDAGLDFEALKRQAQTRDFHPVVFDGSLDASFAVERGTITSRNVIGMLTGRRRPNEVLIYSAHWDHLGVGAPDPKGDRIYNGAIDNGTGVAGILELGRAFARAPRLDRTILFMAPTAEEKGLLGSEYYAANPLFPLATTVADINMDSLSPRGPARDFSMAGLARMDLLDRLVAIAASRGMRYTPDSHPWTGGFYRSDHFPFAKRGVPSISFKSGEDLVEGGTERGQAVNKQFIATAYHQPADEFDPSWSFVDMQTDLGLLYGLGRQLAGSSDWPKWGAASEFEAVRQQSAALRR